MDNGGDSSNWCPYSYLGNYQTFKKDVHKEVQTKALTDIAEGKKREVEIYAKEVELKRNQYLNKIKPQFDLLSCTKDSINIILKKNDAYFISFENPKDAGYESIFRKGEGDIIKETERIKIDVNNLMQKTHVDYEFLIHITDAEKNPYILVITGRIGSYGILQNIRIKIE